MIAMVGDDAAWVERAMPTLPAEVRSRKVRKDSVCAAEGSRVSYQRESGCHTTLDADALPGPPELI